MAVSLADYRELVGTLSSYLESLREEGARRVEVLPDTLALLALPRPRPHRPPPASRKPAPSRPAPVPRPARSRAAAPLMQVICRRGAVCDDPAIEGGTDLRVVAPDPNFRGSAGKLLLQMLTAIGYEPVARATAFAPDQPCAWNLAFGQEALAGLTGKTVSLIMSRGRVQQGPGGTLMPTLAPVDVGDSRDSKRTVWNDLQAMLSHMGLSLPPKT